MSKNYGTVPDIYISIQDYSTKRQKGSFGKVDRSKIEKKIIDSIESIRNGGILVTGYRGVGKSTIVVMQLKF